MKIPKAKFEIGDMVINTFYSDLFLDRIGEISWEWESRIYGYNGFDEEFLFQSYREFIVDHLKDNGNPNFRWRDIQEAYKRWFRK